MRNASKSPESEFMRMLKWVTFSRVLFTSLLLGSTIIFQLRGSPSFLAEPLLFIYSLTITIYVLSFVYTILHRRVKRELLFAYVQIIIDTVIVTLIIYVTGGFSSIFSFLYLVVIIYSSMLLFRRGMEDNYTVDPKFYASKRSAAYNTALSIPGFLLEKKGYPNKTLLAEVPLQAGIVKFLKEQGVNIIMIKTSAGEKRIG